MKHLTLETEFCNLADLRISLFLDLLLVVAFNPPSNLAVSLVGKIIDSSGIIDLKIASVTKLSLLKIIVDFISQQQWTESQVNVI